MDMNQSELLTEILEKPALYIKRGSVELAEAFVSGYVCGAKVAPDPFYLGFNAWLRKHFNITLEIGWASIINFIGQGEADAFILAKKLWKEYGLQA